MQLRLNRLQATQEKGVFGRPFPFLRLTSKPRQVRGFSLIELIVVITIIGVLAVFAMGHYAGRDSFDARGYYDELVSATRFAQRYAVASGCEVQIQINASNYSLTTQDGNCGIGTSVQSPTGGNFSGTAPSGVIVTSGTGPHHFNAMGGLKVGGGLVQMQGGGSTHAFTITPESGFVNAP